MDSYLEEIERTKPMPKTQLLVFMIDELAKYGLEWKTREELFITLFPKKDYKDYEKSWNQWLTQHTEDIRNRSILVSLEERLIFGTSILFIGKNFPKEGFKNQEGRFIRIELDSFREEIIPQGNLGRFLVLNLTLEEKEGN